MKYYLVDAFADQLFSGNPAAVCIRDQWLDPVLMQKIAGENNLAETAFAVPSGREGIHYDLRWFTPNKEAKLCGHATLATAYVLFNCYQFGGEIIAFDTMSGVLYVTKKGDLYELDFPIYPAKPQPISDLMIESLGGVKPTEAYLSEQYLMFLLESDRQVRDLRPDLAKMLLVEEGYHGVVVTAPGEDCDFVSRVFIPAFNIPEDPVNGSSHSSSVPLWVEKLGKDTFVAKMRSERGGTLYCRLQGDRVLIAGKGVVYATCEMHLPDDADLWKTGR